MKASCFHYSSKKSNGFSLIEILVVMFMIGIMSSAVLLSVDIGNPSNDEEVLDKQIEKFLMLSALAEDESVLTGSPIGLVVLPPQDSSTWQFVWQRYRGGEWVDAGDPFKSETFPEDVELTLEVEGELIDFPRLSESDAPPLPSIIFYPGGEITPFLMTLFNVALVDNQTVLTSERIGTIEQLTQEEVQELL